MQVAGFQSGVVRWCLTVGLVWAAPVLRGALVEGEAAWDPGLRDWQAPLELEVAEDAPATAGTGRHLLAGVETGAVVVTYDLFAEARADEARALRFRLMPPGEEAAGEDPAAYADEAAYRERLSDFPGFHEAVALFLLRLGATDWIGLAGVEVPPFRLLDMDELPDWQEPVAGTGD